MKAVQASYIFHHDEKRILLQFENCALLNKLIKSIPGARWSRTYKSWHIPCNNLLYNTFKNNLPGTYRLTEKKETRPSISQQNTTSTPVLKNDTVKTLPANQKVADSKIYPTSLNPANQKLCSNTCSAYN